MATEVFINIKDLPEITQPNNGDYIIIETSTGTHLLDFANLVIPTTNTVITTTVDQNTTAILNNTAAINTISAINETLSSEVHSYTTAILNNTSAINTISAINKTLSAKIYNYIYIGKATATLTTNNTQTVVTISPVPTFTLTSSDIIITPANAYATNYPVYVSHIDGANITIKSGSLSASAESGSYYLMAIRYF